jgi:hypothetical protein
MNTFQDEPTVPGGDEFTDVRASFLNWENLPNAKVAFLEGAPRHHGHAVRTRQHRLPERGLVPGLRQPLHRELHRSHFERL